MRFLFEDYVLDTERRELRRGSTLLSMEPQVFDLLAFLVRNRDRVVSRDDLLASVWGGRIVSESTIASRINAARRIIGDSGEQQRLIRTIIGRGVRFVGMVREHQTRGEPVAPAAVPRLSITIPPFTTRRLAAILAADVAGYSRLMGADEEGTHERLQGHVRELVDPKTTEHRGRVVKNTGDGFLAEFPSVVDAVHCAVEIQRGMIDREPEVPADIRIRFRIGVNLGDVIVEEHDIFGDGVNVAARLESLAAPGGICVSRVVRDQVRDRLDYAFEDLGEQGVKNIARPVRVYRVRDRASPTEAPSPASPQPLPLPEQSLREGPRVGSTLLAPQQPVPAPSATVQQPVEFRQVTVMSCKLDGLAGLASEVEPEELGTQIAVFRDRCREHVSHFGGVISRVAGDGCLAVFGYPQAHEYDSESAVRAGLAIVGAVRRIGECDGRLHTRIGIATGSAVVGDLTGEGTGEPYSVVGDTANLVSGLEALAKFGCSRHRSGDTTAAWRSLRIP